MGTSGRAGVLELLDRVEVYGMAGVGAAAVHVEGKLFWDNAKGEFSNNREANRWVRPTFRKGWELKI
jgi:hypothetical protein